MSDNLDEIVPEDEVIAKKKNKLRRQRNLSQYKNLSDEEFEKIMEKKVLGVEVSDALEKRIGKKWEEFERDYDLSDLKINDRDTLRALIQIQLTLEDYEQEMFRQRSQGISEQQIFSMEKVYKAMSEWRADISKLQNDLMITRKVRKSDKEASALAYVADLQEKAKKFYESKMSYVFCEKCNMLLGTFWTHYPEEDRNKIALVCNRVVDRKTEDGKEVKEICGHKTIVGTKELLKNRGTNNKDITPESML